ncbi:MAG TPA: hydroxyacid dehydrogenase [Candidatus Pelethocola excrementipullorum]|nr:hydroxyacid dehydrogenase [Candidatus Pelethocola excrementipullorum]
MCIKVLMAQDVDEAGKKYLVDNGFELVFAKREDPELMKELIKDCEGVFSKTFFLSEDILSAGKKLKVVAKHGVGIDNIVDLDTATKLGLYVVNTPLANSDSVAEHTIGGLLAFSQKTVEMHQATLKADFEAQNCGGMHEIGSKTIGIVGLGNIGRRVAKIAACGFDMKVIGYDPYAKADVLPDYIEYTDDLDHIYQEADFVTLHLGATPQTIGMMGKKQFEKMKDTAVFLNLARGALMVEEDLVEALTTGQIAGAVLDVYASEPIEPDNPLLKLDNVLLSPHSAALTDEALANMSYGGALGIVEVLTGKKPSWCLNYDAVNEKRK